MMNKIKSHLCKLLFNKITHLALLFICASVLILSIDNSNLIETYSKFQTALFTGFLTIGGFLLSLKIFIVIKMREDLYDSELYKKRFESKKTLNPSLKLYAPLRRLSDFLVYCVICALVTALMQITLGFMSFAFAKALCLTAALFTMILVIFAWWQIKLILSDWFDILEDQS